MDKKLVSREEDYSKWYNDLVVKAGLAENSAVRGCMIIKPYGYAIWEKMQSQLDKMFKNTGHENAYFPLFVPKSLFEAEEKNAEGFAKECAIVTHYRLENDPDKEGKLRVDPKAKLEEELIVRPTSETIIWNTYKNWIQSYRDLPLLVNQWANVVRWEMRTRLFLRTAEFLWQEGHTAHATKDEAVEEAKKMLEVYADFAENFMAMPVIKGVKTESERFAGAEDTYCIEALMQDGKALQAGTSHFLGQNFARAQQITFADATGSESFCWTTSWGVSTRLIGGLIMTHADDDGLVLPPRIAPEQIVLLPIHRSEEDRAAVLACCESLKKQLEDSRWREEPLRVKIDDRDLRGGDKAWQHVKQGVPLRVEIGPRDLAAGAVSLARRDQAPKDRQTLPLEQFVAEAPNLLEQIQQGLFERAVAFRQAHSATIDAQAAVHEFFAADGTHPAGFAHVHVADDPAVAAAAAKARGRRGHDG